jgi:hypothetical protein
MLGIILRLLGRNKPSKVIFFVSIFTILLGIGLFMLVSS